MARHKDWWKARLFSYGPKYVGGRVDGFHITARADDRSESGRFVEIKVPDASVRNLMRAMTEYLERDRRDDAGPDDEE